MMITQKILARAAGRDEVRPGEIVKCEVDRAILTDIQFPSTAVPWRMPTVVPHPERVTVVLDPASRPLPRMMPPASASHVSSALGSVSTTSQMSVTVAFALKLSPTLAPPTPPPTTAPPQPRRRPPTQLGPPRHRTPTDPPPPPNRQLLPTTPRNRQNQQRSTPLHQTRPRPLLLPTPPRNTNPPPDNIEASVSDHLRSAEIG